MDQQQTITVYSIPTIMGGSLTVSVVEDHGAQVTVRVWNGHASPKGWESAGDWDGKTVIVDKSSLTKKRTLELISPAAEVKDWELFVKPFEADNYSPHKISAKYVEVWFDADVYRMLEVDDQGRPLKGYQIGTSDLTVEQIQMAHERRGLSFGRCVKVWTRNEQITTH